MIQLEIGLEGTAQLVVGQDEPTAALGLKALSTPTLVGLIEEAAINAVHSRLEPEFITVGGKVEIEHVAPTPSGTTVNTTAVLTKVEGKRLTFAIRAHDALEEIARGTHERFIVELEGMQERLQHKEDRVPPAPSWTATFKVRWGETDAGGIVFYPNFFTWCNETIGAWLNQVLGLNFSHLMQQEMGFVTREARCEFLGSLVYGDTIEVEVRLAELRQKFFSFQFEIHRLPDLLLVARARTSHVWVKMLPNGELESMPIPAHLRERLEKLLPPNRGA
ncbi:MAG: hypothetical protein D9V47_11865 [Clostridia bacterium]|nr:MAG: hypothetical protein D9V47_11865 [Clostridia bacterium]